MSGKRLLLIISTTLIIIASMTAMASATSYSPYKTGKVNAKASLNVRADASDEGTIKGSLSDGTVITLKEYVKSDGEEWYRITYKSEKAYVWADAVDRISSYDYTIYTPKKYGKVTAEPYLNIRSEASTSSKSIGKIYTGGKIVLKGYKGNWYRVTYNGKTGYISKDYVKQISRSSYLYHNYSPDKYGKVTPSAGLIVREEAGTSADIMSSLDKGTKIVLKGYTYRNGIKWYKIKYAGKYGYVCAKYVKRISKTTYKKSSAGTYHSYKTHKYGKVTASPVLCVRAKATVSAKKLGTLEYGAKKVLYGYSKDSKGLKWYKVKYNGVYAYICADYVKRIEKAEYNSKKSNNSSSVSATGNEVADYALEYLGVPYVWAGESPKGFDCSGLVKYVFAHFGKSLPHYSWDIENYGKAVKYEDAVAGDVICYGDHVAIYLGNGKMVHASYSAGCVTIGQAECLTIRTVRRII